MADVESLTLQITGDATKAKKSLDDLIKTLERLKTITKGGCGLSSVSNEMKKIESGNHGVSTSNTKSAKSFVNLGTKVGAAALALKKAGKIVSSWIKESNDYVENLNLFTVAMGEYAESAKQYAEEVGNLMGIDPSAWMRTQGVFMTLASGFGVASDRAATMSQQLTQLGYDISSFYNTSVEDAMTKLQSGISGELEPLRRLGYDLSQAKLEAIALSLGVDKAVSSMTQAEKAELRYYAIMTQVTTAHGDMARTLNAPANQLRVLKAQATQAGRALGNIFIPALNAILPYAIAAMKVIRELANSIANLFGFTLPEIDYSGVSSLGSDASDASDAIDDVTGSAKKLKKTLLGIDELNVLSDTSGGAGSGSSGGGSLGFELPTYDFMGEISTNIDKAYKKLKKILTPLKKVLGLLWEYKEIVGLGLGLIALTKLWGVLKSVWAWFLGLRLVDAFVTGFQLIRVTGGNVFQSLVGGIDNVRYNLTGMQKTAITVVAAFVEFSVVKKNVKELAMGCEDAGAKIAGIGLAATAAGAAMYVALGPYGLALAAIVGIMGALAGVAQAQREFREALVDAAFFDGVGVSLDVFKSRLEAVTEEFAIQNGQIADWGKEIESNNETIDKVSLKIQALSQTLGSTGAVTQSEIDTIKGHFNSLYEGVRDNMSLSEEVILTALVGALQRATPEIAKQIDVLIGEYQRYVRETQGRAEELKLLIDNGYDELVGKQKNDPAYQEIMSNINAWYTELGVLSGGMSDAGWKWQETVNNFEVSEIDFGNVEQAKEKLGEIASAGKTALDDLAAARDTVLKEIDNQIAYAAQYGTLEEVEMLGDIRQNIEDDYAAQEAAIKSEMNAIFEDIQNGMIGKISDTKEAAEKAWGEMSWLERMWNGNDEEGYVRAALVDLQEKIDEISGAIEGHMSDIETDGSAWASEAMSSIIDSLFEIEGTGDGNVSQSCWKWANTLEEAIEQVFADLEKSGKKASSSAGGEITKGLETGISDESGVRAVKRAAADIVHETDNALRDAAEIHSPSKLFAREGGYMMEGLIKGIKDMLKSLKEAMTSVISSAFDTDDAWNHGYDYGSSFAKGIVKAIKNTSFPTITGTVNTSGSSASISFKAYANGGFPAEGQMFVAREAGPELVGTIGSRSAVANNDQIVESVSKGVYRAVVQAMGQSNGSQVVEAKVNDKVLFEVVVDRNRRETMRTGRSPLLGGV